MSQPKIDVKALAALARLDVSDAERAVLEKQIPDILAFVETIQKASAEVSRTDPALRNVMRDDAGAHEGGIYTQELLRAAPAQKDDHVVVVQVISKRK